jgi:2-oxoglutarate ferredoxin oxidoreductase subunit beta
MTFIAKPEVRHPGLPTNELGLTTRDYEGVMSTLCAGCGHDSVTAALIEAFFELAIAPHRVAKLSGIGCSSKTTAYFLNQAHGFNSVHGRMPSIATGANAANRDLIYVGISGDGDSLSIGLGQLCHAIRRNINMLYIIENNGVYGLTKGQFSASADVGSLSKRGDRNPLAPMDPVALALGMGGTFVARSFSGDKPQLVPILKAGLAHPGFALVDVISPCVTFNDHQGSTKSYLFTRQHHHKAVSADFVPMLDEIETEYGEGRTIDVTVHGGGVVRFRKVPEEYDPTDRDAVTAYLGERHQEGEIVTGLLFLEPESSDYLALKKTVATPLVDLPFEDLCPGREQLAELMNEFR